MNIYDSPISLYAQSKCNGRSYKKDIRLRSVMSTFSSICDNKIKSHNDFNQVSFKELIPQSFRNKDIVILNKFDNSVYLKKQILNKYLGVVGVPIAFGNLSHYTFDRIDSDSNLNIKVNSVQSLKSIYKNGIKYAVSPVVLNTFSVQRRHLLKKRKIRRKLKYRYFLSSPIKRIKLRKLFKIMSNQIRNNLNSRISGMVSSLSFKRHLFKYNKRKII